MTDKNLLHDKSNAQLQDELLHKLATQFSNDHVFVEYLLATKKNFLYRYLETSTDKDLTINSISHNEFEAMSFESNMGEAFKTQDKEIKEAVKNLAKTVKKEDHPKVCYMLKTKINSFHNGQGKIEIQSSVNWGFPNFSSSDENEKRKKIIFNFQDVAQFRKELALKYEEACELFL